MEVLPILIFALLLLGGLLVAEKIPSTKGMLLTKPFLSALFVVALFSLPHAVSTYFYLILAGLIFCWLGDVSLIFFSQRKLFTLGLVAFLIGHLFYAFAFFRRGGWTSLAWLALPLVVLVSGFIFVKFRPHLGAMLGPVSAYIFVISLMLLAAWSLLGNHALPFTARAMTAVGALSFYISDIFVARQRFVKPEYVNRFVGLSLYYVGQFLIAFAAGGLSG